MSRAANHLSARFVMLATFETLLIATAVAVAAYLRLNTTAWDILFTQNGALKILLIAGVSQVCLYYADLYDFHIVSDRRKLFTRMVQALVSASLILAALYFWVPALIIGRGVLLIAAFLALALVVSWRVLLECLGRHIRPRERLLLVGTD